jgi:serine protease Do
VVTNRHVVDPDFSAPAPARASLRSGEGNLRVKLLGQAAEPGEVLWIAPDGIDLALVRVGVHTADARTAPWRRQPRLGVGDEVFSIGNPHHLDWTHTRGWISQFRTQTRGARKIRVIQTDAAINPGNSGGGLYDKEGMLIGINTWTEDKQFAQGLSFAIAFETLLQLDPPPLRSPVGRASSPPGKHGQDGRAATPQGALPP